MSKWIIKSSLVICLLWVFITSALSTAIGQKRVDITGAIWLLLNTPNKTWGTAELIQAVDQRVYLTHVAVDAEGNAFVVWTQKDDNAIPSAWVNRYETGKGWETAELLAHTTGFAGSPQVAFDTEGNAMAVWYQSDGITGSKTGGVWSRRYEQGTGWGTAELIGPITAMEISPLPQIAIDVHGNAMAVWSQWLDYNDSIWSNRYEPGTGWGTAELVEHSSYDAAYPRVATDANGNAMVVWRQLDSGKGISDIRSNRYDPGTGWGTAELVSSGDSDSVFPQIAIDSNGNAIALWNDGLYPYQYRVFTNRYVPGAGWGIAELFADGGDTPRIATDANGNAMVVWKQWDEGISNIRSKRYEPGTGWGTAELVEHGTDYADSPHIAINPYGIAMAVWAQGDYLSQHIWSSRYVPGMGWGKPESIDRDASCSSLPEIALDPRGNAIAVWAQATNTTCHYTNYRIWANRFE